MPEKLSFQEKLQQVNWEQSFGKAGKQAMIAGISTGVVVYAVDHPKFRNFAAKVKNLSYERVSLILKRSGFSDETIEAFCHRFGVHKKLNNGVDLAWIDDLVGVLPNDAKTKISNWVNEGLDAEKIRGAFISSTNKTKLFLDLDNALGKYHRQVIVHDFDGLPGLTFFNRVENSYPNGHVLQNTKVKLPSGAYDPDFNVSYPGDVMSFVNGTAELIELPAGTKLYRVCKDGMNDFTGGYWTRTKPASLEEVIGGTAVQPEWNTFNNIVEYTVPDGGIFVWKGNAASQKLSNDLGISNPHLSGGSEQILVPLKYRRLKKSDGSFDFVKVNPDFSKNIVELLKAQILWK